MSKTVIAPHTAQNGYLMEDGIFGVNMEITRRGFFGGLCAQMLNNRKLSMGEGGVDGWVCEGARRVLNRPEESLCQSNFITVNIKLDKACFIKLSLSTVSVKGGQNVSDLTKELTVFRTNSFELWLE